MEGKFDYGRSIALLVAIRSVLIGECVSNAIVNEMRICKQWKKSADQGGQSMIKLGRDKWESRKRLD